MVFLTDSNVHIEWVNEAFTRVTGFSAEDAQQVVDNAFNSSYNVVKDFEATGKKVRVNLIRADSNPFLSQLRTENFDFIYIDGSHRYSDVKYDIQQSKRLAKTTGAIICGDDYELYPNPDNLNELYAQKDDDQALHHPGVSLAIYEEFGARVNVINGFWWVFTHNGEYSREFDKIDTDPNPSVF